VAGIVSSKESRCSAAYEKADEPFLKTGLLSDTGRAMQMGAKLMASHRRKIRTAIHALFG
jgi:hypothetical protein